MTSGKTTAKGSVTVMHPNEELIRKVLDAFNSRDLDRLQTLVSDDMTLYCPGKNLVSGVYRGLKEVRGFWTKQIEVSDGTLRPEIVDILVSDERLATLLKMRGEKAGRPFEWRRLALFRVSNGKLLENRIYEENQETADEFFGAKAR